METRHKEMYFVLAVIPLIVMIAAMLVTIVLFDGSPHIPLILGTSVSAFIAWTRGYRWKELEESMYKGIRLALPAVAIIMMVGLTIGAWIGGGIVATMIYYGLKIITPSLFLVAIAIICAIVSLAIGSSWSTMGTIGVAAMGIGMSMGISAPMVAGAIISGAYFGDKMSPLSDTTNLASGLTETNLFEHIGHMLYTTVPAFMITLVIYWFFGRDFGSKEMDKGTIDQTMSVMQDSFFISPWLLLVPVAVIFLVMRKVPALPALFFGIILGFLCQILMQGGNIGDAVNTLQTGYSIDTGNKWLMAFLIAEGLNR
ncbi:Malate-2H(+)/Na(+)-lactate antiporter [Halobacillus karajensis]|uniref:Malate-2H(+)/Na(+)-lactate antiporter n=1 Tax=Halobacillus karajensis TaxID=195088 RepID=A0A024PB02_9BACI|nr:Malate-2H(+)/Na(+)-lactate antiporter [Halobacillus karajensis]CDQ25607.1 Malate-2H(+)/Na(+)-lactate antiporter [Halobacillus karajensis]CDQ25878.1 Malate-2H(+)/Na(+)-lactate antiporter [Halobacillus karajensis]